MSLERNDKRGNKARTIRKFEEEMILYQKIYDLKSVTNATKVTKEYFDYCKTKRNFIILVLYDRMGRVYLREKGINQFTFLGGEVIQNESTRDAVKRIISQLIEKTTIEELEPIAISKNTFKYNSEIVEHLGLVVMARIDLKPMSKVENKFYAINESVYECINQFSDKKILEMFSQRFSQIVFYNNHEFQHEEIEVNKKYRSRYKFHNEIIKKYVLTSKRKHKEELIRMMSEKVIGCSTLLDVSCGDNSLLFSLNYDSNFEFIVANDISWSQIELIPPQKHVIFTNHNAITFPFKDNVFDFVYCSNTLHHIPNEENLINLLNSMLRVGKKIVIYEIEDPEVTGGFPYYLNKYWYRGFLKDAGEQYLSAKDFKKIITETYGEKAKIKFSNFRNIQGNYMIAEIEKWK